jgi:hypothetical protein
MRITDPNEDLEDLPQFEVSESSYYENLEEEKYSKQAKQINEEGYTILDLNQSVEIFEIINEKIDKKIFEGNPKLNPKYYHYNDNPRIIEGWRYIKEIVDLARDKNVLGFLEYLYKKRPIPFSTINFIKSSEQPLHSDYMHFSSKPERYLTGVWFALEDIDINSGPLQVVPKSHKLPITTLEDLSQDIPKNTKQLKENYTEYEEHVKKVVNHNNLNSKKITLKKNQCLIWSANLLHGGSPINDEGLTRKSLVVHYHYGNCIYYNPGFSKLSEGVMAERKIEEINY